MTTPQGLGDTVSVAACHVKKRVVVLAGECAALEDCLDAARGLIRNIRVGRAEEV